MPAPTYGTPSPRALDPWTIENTLAPLAYAGDRSQLQSELGSYQLQRAAAEGQYGHELDAQHQYAKQQLAQQLYEAKLKEIAPIAGKPGGTQFLAGMPGMEGFGSPSSWANFAGAANTAQGAENYKNLGAGFKDFSEGGSLQPVQQLPGMGGIQDTLTDNARVRTELIKQQTSLANAHADRTKPVTANVSGQGVMNADGSYTTTSYSRVPLGQEAAYQKRIDDANEARRRERAGEPPLTPASSGGPGASSTVQPTTPAVPTAPATRPASTSLTPKPLPPPPPPPPGMARVDTNSPNGDAMQKKLIVATDRWSKDPKTAGMAQNIRNNMDGTTFKVYNHPTQGLVAQGRDGSLYVMQPPAAKPE